jgi:hypothetical protein
MAATKHAPTDGNSQMRLKFGRWTVLGEAERDAEGRQRWFCRCDCGTEAVQDPRELRRGGSRSCGCVTREKAAARREALMQRPRRVKRNALPPVDQLHKLFVYDHNAKGLRWRVDRNKARAGNRAGSINGQGRRLVKIDGMNYYEHRLVWKMLKGEEPPEIVDHIRIKDVTVNSLTNLRAVSKSESVFHRSTFSNNKTGVTGVWWDRTCEKWIAAICVNHHQIALGRFDKFKDAVAARRAAELQYYGTIAAEMQRTR